MGNEGPITHESEIAFLEMMNMFSKHQRFTRDRQGLLQATQEARAQHQRATPNLDIAELRRMVMLQDSSIPGSAERVAMQLVAGNPDYLILMRNLNLLYALGEQDRLGSLGGEAFILSLQTHRAVLSHIIEHFGQRDGYLRNYWARMLPDINAARQRRDFAEELGQQRAVIHTVVLNGTLGEQTKLQFDPFAIVDEHSIP